MIENIIRLCILIRDKIRIVLIQELEMNKMFVKHLDKMDGLDKQVLLFMNKSKIWILDFKLYLFDQIIRNYHRAHFQRKI